MTPYCRACGTEHDIAYRDDWAMEDLALTVSPSWLDALCNECLHDLSRRVPTNQDGEPLRSVLPDDLVLFLADVTNLYAMRVASKASVERCEVLASSYFAGGHDHQCRRFASHHHDNRPICGLCLRRILKGARLAFVGSRQFPVRPFIIWARSAEEFIAEAHRIASSIAIKEAS